MHNRNFAYVNRNTNMNKYLKYLYERIPSPETIHNEIGIPIGLTIDIISEFLSETTDDWAKEVPYSKNSVLKYKQGIHYSCPDEFMKLYNKAVDEHIRLLEHKNMDVVAADISELWAKKKIEYEVIIELWKAIDSLFISEFLPEESEVYGLENLLHQSEPKHKKILDKLEPIFYKLDEPAACKLYCNFDGYAALKGFPLLACLEYLDEESKQALTSKLANMTINITAGKLNSLIMEQVESLALCKKILNNNFSNVCFKNNKCRKETSWIDFTEKAGKSDYACLARVAWLILKFNITEIEQDKLNSMITYTFFLLPRQQEEISDFVQSLLDKAPNKPDVDMSMFYPEDSAEIDRLLTE